MTIKKFQGKTQEEAIAKAKEDLEAFNKTKISSIFDNMASLADKITDLSGGFATIGKAFEGKGFQKIVEVAEKVFNVTVLNNIDLFTGLLSDLVGSFRSVSDNADGFKQVLEDIFDIVGDLLSPIGDLMDFIAGRAASAYFPYFSTQLFSCV